MSIGEVIVIGGGITGSATAYELGKKGIHVTLLDREAIHSMGSGWTLAGVRQSGRHIAEMPIARAAIRRWENLGEELGAEIHYRQNGNLRLAFNPEDIATVKQVVADGVASGVPMEWVDGDKAREIAPMLSESILGASYCATDGHADNIRTVRAYIDAAKRQGASVIEGAEVQELLTTDGRVTGVVTADGILSADAVVVAAGVYSPRLLEPLGLSLSIHITQTPVVQTVPTTAVSLKPVLGVATGNFAARQTADGAIRFIGQGRSWNEPSPHTEATNGILVNSLAEMTNRVKSILPAVGDLRVDRVWGGLIDKTPDLLPVLDAVPQYEGLVVGAGFAGHGFGIGPVSGEILANLVMEGKDDRFDLQPFTLARFADGAVEEQSLEMHG